MSSRDKTRATAKRMLVFFEEDKSTCILGTKFVKRIIDGSNKLTDRAQVMVDYEGQEYRAVIIKLHGTYSIVSFTLISNINQMLIACRKIIL